MRMEKCKGKHRWIEGGHVGVDLLIYFYFFNRTDTSKDFPGLRICIEQNLKNNYLMYLNVTQL